MKQTLRMVLLVTAVGSVALTQGLLSAFYEDRAPVLNVKVEVVPADLDAPPSDLEVQQDKYRCSVVVFADQTGHQSLAIHNVIVARGQIRSEAVERGDLKLRFAVELRKEENWAITSVELRRGRDVIGRQDSAILLREPVARESVESPAP